MHDRDVHSPGVNHVSCLQLGKAQGEPEVGEDVAFAIGYLRWTLGGKSRCCSEDAAGGIHGDAANLI